MLYNNASIGDALFTGTPAGAGGVTVSAGGDNYQIDHNWIAGNLSTGDGGGVQILGVNFDGKINNNVILFNQSTNPTLPTNGGGIVVQGANEPRTLAGTECGGATDTDCPPGLGDGTGARLVIDGNLIYGNSAESGTGGGIALEMINGSEVIAFPNTPNNWYGVKLINNIIANNVAGYDGGGISMRDALKLSFINNTIVSNDTTASAGVLFKTLGAINASSPPPGCNAQTDPTLPQDPSCLGKDAPHGPQPSGLVTMAHTQNLNDAIGAIVVTGSTPRLTCPSGFGYANGTGTGNLNNGDCIKLSKPALVNDLFWQNRTFHVDLAGVKGPGLQSQQNLVIITPQLTQTTTGECAAGAQFWDIGLRTDDVQAGLNLGGANRLTITNSILTGTGDISNLAEIIPNSSNKVNGPNPVIAQVCNGARVPPEYCGSADVTGGQNGAASCKGYNAPPGASESTSTSPLFVFNGIQPTATVDEGHNWLNLVYGPLTLNRTDVGQSSSPAELMVASAATGTVAGAYSITGNSPAIGAGVAQTALDHDFFGNSRPTTGAIAIGAVERQGAPVVTVTPGALTFNTLAGTNGTLNLTVSNTGGGQFTGLTVTIGGANAAQFARNGGTCGATVNVGATCTIGVRFTAPTGTAGTTYLANVAISGNVPVAGSPVALTGLSQAPTFLATVSPSQLAFGNWASGTTSSALSLTVTNTGNSQLTGLTYTFGGGTPTTFSRAAGGFGAGGTCGNTLAVGASCTYNVVFAPGSAAIFSRTLTVAGAGAIITGSPVTLTGSGVGARSPVTVSPLTITTGSLAACGTPSLTLTYLACVTASGTATGTVTFTNSATAGSQVNVTNIGTTGGGFSVDSNTCINVALAPQQSCTATVRFTNFGARGTNRIGAISFTDTGLASPQSATLTGFATP
jgi:hypothetical protein